LLFIHLNFLLQGTKAYKAVCTSGLESRRLAAFREGERRWRALQREPGKGASLYHCYRKTPHAGFTVSPPPNGSHLARAGGRGEGALVPTPPHPRAAASASPARRCLARARLPSAPHPWVAASASPVWPMCHRRRCHLTHMPLLPHPHAAAAATSPTCRCRLTRMPPPLPRLMCALDEEQAPRGRGTPASAQRGGSCRRHSRGGWLARTPS
jgi:hypothetical protein